MVQAFILRQLVQRIPTNPELAHRMPDIPWMLHVEVQYPVAQQVVQQIMTIANFQAQLGIKLSTELFIGTPLPQ